MHALGMVYQGLEVALPEEFVMGGGRRHSEFTKGQVALLLGMERHRPFGFSYTSEFLRFAQEETVTKGTTQLRPTKYPPS